MVHIKKKKNLKKNTMYAINRGKVANFFFTISTFVFQTLNFLFCTGVQLVNNVVVVSGEQQRNSVIHTYGAKCMLTKLNISKDLGDNFLIELVIINNRHYMQSA